MPYFPKKYPIIPLNAAIPITRSILQAGQNPSAVQVHQFSIGQLDIGPPSLLRSS